MNTISLVFDCLNDFVFWGEQPCSVSTSVKLIRRIIAAHSVVLSCTVHIKNFSVKSNLGSCHIQSHVIQQQAETWDLIAGSPYLLFQLISFLSNHSLLSHGSFLRIRQSESNQFHVLQGGRGRLKNITHFDFSPGMRKCRQNIEILVASYWKNK